MTNEEVLEAVYSKILKHGDVAIDVGAHIGRHCIPMAKLVGEAGRVYAFEPIPAIAEQLLLNLHKAHVGNVKFSECALADKAGNASFVFVNEAPGYSGLKERTYDFDVTKTVINVDVRKLDDVLGDQKVNFIKIDCEGAEFLVMRGALNILRNHRPVVSFESGDASLLNYDYDAGAIYDFWAALNYSVTSLDGREHSREEFISANAAQQYWDYVAWPRS